MIVNAELVYKPLNDEPGASQVKDSSIMIIFIKMPEIRTPETTYYYEG